MNVQFALINADTGESIYDVILNKDDVLKDSHLLVAEVGAAVKKLATYRPRYLPLLDSATGTSDPASAEFQGDYSGDVDMGL